MSLLDEVITEEAAATTKGSCAVCRWFEDQPNNEREEWVELMLTRSRISAAIWRVMVKRGYTKSKSTVERHRKEVHDRD